MLTARQRTDMDQIPIDALQITCLHPHQSKAVVYYSQSSVQKRDHGDHMGAPCPYVPTWGFQGSWVPPEKGHMQILPKVPISSMGTQRLS